MRSISQLLTVPQRCVQVPDAAIGAAVRSAPVLARRRWVAASMPLPRPCARLTRRAPRPRSDIDAVQVLGQATGFEGPRQTACARCPAAGEHRRRGRWPGARRRPRPSVQRGSMTTARPAPWNQCAALARWSRHRPQAAVGHHGVWRRGRRAARYAAGQAPDAEPVPGTSGRWRLFGHLVESVRPNTMRVPSARAGVGRRSTGRPCGQPGCPGVMATVSGAVGPASAAAAGLRSDQGFVQLARVRS